MFGSIWQIIRGVYTRRRSGIDKGNIEHLRADLRFRLAMVEYAYFGRSGRRVTRCLSELKSVLGEKAVHRYLRTLDPDLRTQFVERFQGVQRSAGAVADPTPGRPVSSPARAAPSLSAHHRGPAPASNVVPFNYAVRRTGVSGNDDHPGQTPRGNPDTRSVDSSD